LQAFCSLLFIVIQVLTLFRSLLIAGKNKTRMLTRCFESCVCKSRTIIIVHVFANVYKGIGRYVVVSQEPGMWRMIDRTWPFGQGGFARITILRVICGNKVGQVDFRLWAAL
jgi:hypothetical protein